MDDKELLRRIESNPDVLGGKPVIKGSRLAVDFIVNLLGHGASVDEIIDEYKEVTRSDIQACLLFAARSLSNATFMPFRESA